MRVHVEALGVLAPGLPDWQTAVGVLGGGRALSAEPLVVPAPASLAPAERRRSSPTVRLALAAAEQALARTAVPAPDMAMVFSSREASGVITHQICEVLAGTREVSPTQFHNSVHNAPSGYYSIGMHAKRAATSVCRGEWSFAAGLLNAAAQLLADGVPVLYVCYDSPLPPPIVELLPIVESTAVAMVLTAAPGAVGSWEIDVAPRDGDDGNRGNGWPAWMPAAWHANASARGFAALATLADPACRTAALPLSPDLDLRVARC